VPELAGYKSCWARTGLAPTARLLPPPRVCDPHHPSCWRARCASSPRSALSIPWLSCSGNHERSTRASANPYSRAVQRMRRRQEAGEPPGTSITTDGALDLFFPSNPEAFMAGPLSQVSPIVRRPIIQAGLRSMLPYGTWACSLAVRPRFTVTEPAGLHGLLRHDTPSVRFIALDPNCLARRRVRLP